MERIRVIYQAKLTFSKVEAVNGSGKEREENGTGVTNFV